MGLFSFSRKNKQEPVSSDGEFYSRADEESAAIRGRGKRKDKQSNDPVDPVLPEKKRARRRLVGAIALVLAAIIGLPMIFDSEPKPVADDITIQIPSKDKPANKGSISNQPVIPSASKTAASASLDAKEEIVEPSNNTGVATAIVTGGAAVATAAAYKISDKKSEPVRPGTADKTAGKVQIAEIQPEAKQAQKTNAKTESKAEPKSGASADQKSNDVSKAKDKGKAVPVNADTSKVAADKNSGKFVLQVAALLTQEKINELQGKLKKAGFTTFTQKVATESGVSTRIRVGPYATKEEADKARAKLLKMGLNGTPVSR
ncbi:MAG TPA: SPOR domain-containing protein [Burkholderiaceae bacterium]